MEEIPESRSTFLANLQFLSTPLSSHQYPETDTGSKKPTDRNLSASQFKLKGASFPHQQVSLYLLKTDHSINRRIAQMILLNFKL